MYADKGAILLAFLLSPPPPTCGFEPSLVRKEGVGKILATSLVLEGL